jgi:hypothetical protein
MPVNSVPYVNAQRYDFFIVPTQDRGNDKKTTTVPLCADVLCVVVSLREQPFKYFRLSKPLSNITLLPVMHPFRGGNVPVLVEKSQCNVPV